MRRKLYREMRDMPEKQIKKENTGAAGKIRLNDPSRNVL